MKVSPWFRFETSHILDSLTAHQASGSWLLARRKQERRCKWRRTSGNSRQGSLTVARIIAELIRLQNIIEGMAINKNYKAHLTRGMDMERETLEKALLETTQHMGYLHFHPHQRMVVKHFVKGRYMFVSLPTGSSKSFCYCCVPLVFCRPRIWPQDASHIVVVVSPLTALWRIKWEHWKREMCMVLMLERWRISVMCVLENNSFYSWLQKCYLEMNLERHNAKSRIS